jgi:hypothetical protein
MAINENDISRFLAGRMAAGDPALPEVAAFLQRLDSVFPTASTAGLEAGHLAAVINEARQVRETSALAANKVAPPVKTPRLAVATAIAAVIALGAGVGVAAAMAPAVTPKPAPLELVAAPMVPTSATPTPSPSEEAQPADLAQQRPAAKPAARPAAPRTHKAKPAPKPSEKSEASHDSDHEDSAGSDDSREHDDED